MAGRLEKIGRRLISCSLVGITTLSTVAGAAFLDSADVLAGRTTLKGINELADSLDTSKDANVPPLTILEIVPELANASIGYLIGGEEPIYQGRSLKDMPSVDERISMMTEEGYFNKDSIPKSLLDKGAITVDTYSEGDTKGTRISIRGHFTPATPSGTGRYNRIDPENAYSKYTGDVTALYDDGNTAGVVLFNKTYEYRTDYKEDGATGYKLVLKAVANDFVMPGLISGSYATGDDIYNGQYFSLAMITEEDGEDYLTEGAYVFATSVFDSEDSEQLLEYVGQIKPVEFDEDGKPVGTGGADISPAAAGRRIVLSEIDNGYYLAEALEPAPVSPVGEEPASPNGEAAPPEGGGESPGGSTEPTETPTPTEEEPTATPMEEISPSVEPTGEVSPQVSPTGEVSPTEEVSPTVSPLVSPSVSPTGLLPSQAPKPEKVYVSKGIHPALVMMDGTVMTAAEMAEAEDKDYFYGNETNNVDPDKTYYRIKSATPNANSPFGQMEFMKEVAGNPYSMLNAPTGRTYYVKGGTGSDYEYVGTTGGNYDFVTDYTEDIVESFYKTGGIENSEWFKNNVLDRTTADEYNNTSIDVVTITPDMLTEELIGKAGLIYINGNADSDHQMTTAMAKLIQSKAADGSIPVMIERSTLTKAKTDIGSGNDMDRLAVMLMQKGNVPANTNWESADWGALYDSMFHFTVEVSGAASYEDYSQVHGRVFVNDDLAGNTTGTGQGKIVNGDFKDTYSSVKAEKGFSAVSEFNSREETKIKYLFTEEGWNSFNKTISKATSIRYILNNNESYTETKDSLAILDLEPYQTSHLSEDFLKRVSTSGYNGTVSQLTQDILTKDWFVGNVGRDYKPEQITIEQIGTHEFIGLNDNLNELYDCIYIGMDTTLMNTEINGSTKTDKTVYNDSGMNGLVYTHVGDTVNYDSGSEDGYVGTYRQSGTDITLDKFNALKRYIQTGYAVLLSDEMFIFADNGNIQINTTKVDRSSYMYRLLEDVVLEKTGSEYKYLGRNVNYRKAFTAEDTKDEAVKTFNEYMSISKLDVELTGRPTEWAGEHYLEKSSDGLYHLEFDADLKYNTAATAAGITYTCKLYIDSDNDGKFEDPQEDNVSDESIYVYVTDGSGNAVDPGSLTAGSSYHIDAPIDKDYVGLICWKIAFIENPREGESADFIKDVRVSESGFAAVAPEGEPPVIKVLQLYSEGWRENTLWLNKQQSYFDQVDDFDIQVDVMDVRDFISKSISPRALEYNNTTDVGNIGYKEGLEYIDFLNQYDMLVLGFTDFYEWKTWAKQIDSNRYKEDAAEEAIMAVREFTLSGKSVLFTHDNTTTVEYGTSYSAAYFNQYMRDVLGMDRYGITEGNLRSGGYTDAKYAYSFVYDHSYLKGDSTGETLGMLDVMLTRFGSQAYGYLANPNIKNWNEGGWNKKAKDVVSMLNQGQITQYPFLITTEEDDSFQVAATHSQVFQLNLDTNSDDANTDDDVVVWYTLGSKKAYNAGGAGIGYFLYGVPNDARNNYYIYSRGNVFYTGAGHINVVDDKEIKLFVNTLVAAYRNGIQSPKITYKENPWETSANITRMYMPYDPNMVNDETVDTDLGGYIEKDVAINFYTDNGGMKNSNEALRVKYYVEQAGAEGADLTIGTGEDARYFREIVPKSLKKAMDQGLTAVTDTGTVDNYSVYQGMFDSADISAAVMNGSLDAGGSVRFYIRIGTTELQNGSLETLNPTETINLLDIYRTDLFDLE